jgi:hypothetical protein
MKNRMERYGYQGLLVLIIILAIYPLSFFQFIPKWDNIIGYLPYRYFIGDYLWHGHMPLWNPFQRFGYPGYSDLQSGCWYPVVWIILLFGKYTITSLIAELVLCFIIAGLGMYTLVNYLYHSPKTAFLIGLCYALSGFMVGSTQLMVFLIGAAWLPWCIWAFLVFLHTRSMRSAAVAAAFVAVEISGASPAFTIILAYILAGMLAYYVWNTGRNWRTAGELRKGGLLMAGLLLLLLLPYIQSFLEFAPYFNRSGKLDYTAMVLNPFTWKDYISFVFPYTVISNCDWFNETDLSLRNAYAGISGILLFVFSFVNRDNRGPYFRVLVAGFVISLVLAMGDEFIIYRYAYYLPGFGMFRHPSFFRIYAVLCLLLIGGAALRQIISRGVFSRTENRVLLCFFASLLAIVVFSFVMSPAGELGLNLKQISSSFEFSTAGFFSHLFIGAAILLVLAALGWTGHRSGRWSVFALIAVITVFDLVIQTRLTAPTTMHYGVPYRDVKEYFDALPGEHSQSFNTTPLGLLDDSQGLLSTNGITLNLATFNKSLSSVGENPMRFKSFDTGRENGVVQRNGANPIICFAQKEFEPGDSLRPGLIWNTPSPVIVQPGTAQLGSIHVGYNRFTAHISNEAEVPQWIILNQNFHRQWKAALNEAELPVYRVNEMVMGVLIPPHTSGELRFDYSSPYLVYSAAMSVLGYASVMIWWIVGVFPRRRRKEEIISR